MNLNDELQSYINKSFTAPDNDMYHYTPSSEKILTSKCLYLSFHEDLNSKNHYELTSSKQLIIKEMKKNQSLSPLIPYFLQYVKNSVKFYTFSCCESFKNNFRMRKRYGKEAIVLTKDFIHQIAGHNGVLLSRIIYDSVDQKRIITQIFKIYEKLEKNTREDSKVLFLWLTIVLPLFKKETFAWEGECRFICAEIFLPTNNSFLLTKPCFKKISFAANDVYLKD